MGKRTRRKIEPKGVDVIPSLLLTLLFLTAGAVGGHPRRNYRLHAATSRHRSRLMKQFLYKLAWIEESVLAKIILTHEARDCLQDGTVIRRLMTAGNQKPQPTRQPRFSDQLPRPRPYQRRILADPIHLQVQAKLSALFHIRRSMSTIGPPQTNLAEYRRQHFQIPGTIDTLPRRSQNDERSSSRDKNIGEE